MGTPLLRLSSQQAHGRKPSILLLIKLPGTPLLHQQPVFIAVGLPAHMLFRVKLQQLLRWRKGQLMHIAGSGKPRHKKGQILFLGETAKLGAVLQPDVQDQIRLLRCQTSKKIGSGNFIGT